MSEEKTKRMLTVALINLLSRDIKDKAPSAPKKTKKELAAEVGTWRVLQLSATWFSNLAFIIYSSALLGVIGVPFWMWLIWGGYVLSHLSSFFVWLMQISVTKEYAEASDAETQDAAIETTERDTHDSLTVDIEKENNPDCPAGE